MSSSSDTRDVSKSYKGFVGGLFSGVAKLTVGHPFDTIKVRMQTSTHAQFSGPLECLITTIRKEGLNGLYKGATPPLLGWMVMDSVLLGSMQLYRRLLLAKVFNASGPSFDYSHYEKTAVARQLPLLGHGIAGMMAGATVSFVAAPVEHLKARLQVQYSSKKSESLYKGPVDCLMKIYRHHGVRGVYHGLAATLLFRAFFIFWWSSYEFFTRQLMRSTNLSEPSINFWAGGLSAQVFWLTSYPSDVVKQRIMTDPLGGTLNDGTPKFPNWRSAAMTIYRDHGTRGFWRGFLPCFLRAFPANAASLVVFEAIMRNMP